MKRVILHHDLDGLMTVFLEEGAGVEVINVCDASPSDRAYRYSPDVVSSDEIDAIIGPGPVGHKDDDRHPALAARLIEAVEGTPRLSIVPKEDIRP